MWQYEIRIKTKSLKQFLKVFFSPANFEVITNNSPVPRIKSYFQPFIYIYIVKCLPGGSWLPSAGRYPIVQQWHDAGEMPSRKKLPRETLDAGGRNWPSTIVYTVSGSSLMRNLNHGRVPAAVGTVSPRSHTCKWRDDQEKRRRQRVQVTLLRQHKNVWRKTWSRIGPCGGVDPSETKKKME
jgi:hypothetical protein